MNGNGESPPVGEGVSPLLAMRSSKSTKSLRGSRTSLFEATGVKGPMHDLLSVTTDEENKLREEEGERREESETLSQQLDKEFLQEDSDAILESILTGDISSEEKIAEMHGLISSQRRTILNLSKTNQDLNVQYEKMQKMLERKLEEYKKHILDSNSHSLSHVKDFEVRMEALEASNRAALEENVELHRTNDHLKSELESAESQIAQLKATILKMHSQQPSQITPAPLPTLESNDSKGFGKELIRIRKELDLKEDELNDKNAQIQMMKLNIDVLSKKLETAEKLRENSGLLPVRDSGKTKEPPKQTPFTDKKTINQNIRKMVKARSSQTKEQLAFFDKNVIKPIRGGGGDLRNFERQNFLVDEKEEFQDGEGVEGDEKKGSTPRVSKVKQMFSAIESRIPEQIITNDDVSESFQREFNEAIFEDGLHDVERKFANLGARVEPQQRKSTVNTIFKGFKNLFG
eukprot:TRINITY_DN2572_c0_g1_i8.p1 TRINITY_DN2572_c0_g1~~TRINITY_DN2572_c0_g1_i8.p1  ORF type:complete len:461 (-),score=162.75 TRINITY_DN2572_c0_g1_i8:64-1446(-)